MKPEMTFKVAPTAKAPTAAIERIEPKHLTDCNKCEANIHIGLFFDGTNNRRDDDLANLKHSNVARLYDAYLEEPTKGYYKRYVPGVGTRFPEIREKGESWQGSGFAIGCEQRVLFALTFIFDAIHSSASGNTPFFTDEQVTALCCNHFVDPHVESEDSIALGRLGLSFGLRMPTLHGDGRRTKILKDLAKQLQTAVAKGRPRIKECFIDVFGFSRGAAEARVFCSWLDEILTDGKLAGVIIHFRFLGVMDTVASAGFWSTVVSAATGADGGHSGWAAPQWLRIPASVQNCVHMVAAHELRRNFPLDTITIDGALLPHCQEFVYPGAHSDVGGGYAPHDLGIAIDHDLQKADALKLSQIPLNHMLACAQKAGAPISKATAMGKEGNYDPFSIAPAAQKAYDDFVAFSTLTPRTVHEWLQPYLNWRWEVRKSYTSLKHVRLASAKDRSLLLDYNAKLVADAAFLDRTAKGPSLLSMVVPGLREMAQIDAARLNCFDDEARSVLALAKAAAPTEIRLHTLFDEFVHDSLAGFDQNWCELTGYWRYRKGFLGNEKKIVAENDVPTSATSNTA